METNEQDIEVFSEILDWSSTRPEWQRDALRRMVEGPALSEEDVSELIEHCKAAHGLAEFKDTAPLEERHLPKRGRGKKTIKLTSLTHHGGVNALAAKQTLEIGPNLTIVYGGNAAGKSGYTRILKRACRARGDEEILGNVLDTTALGRPSATIRFEVGGEADEFKWKDQEESHVALSQVSVFDRHCAAVYIGKKTDVAFRPLGLDLFDKLSDVCELVRKALEKERRDLDRSHAVIPDFGSGTKVYKLVSSLSSLTKPDDVQQLGKLSDKEKDRLIELRKRKRDLQSEDPHKTATLLTLRARRIMSLSSHMEVLDKFVGDKALTAFFRAGKDMEKAAIATKSLHEGTFTPDLLSGTGSSSWQEMWEYARKFSSEHAYPDDQFPVTHNESKCLLCQQKLGTAAKNRLERFEEFLQSTVQQKHDRAKTEFQMHLQNLENLTLKDETRISEIEDLKIESEELAKSAADAIESAKQRRDKSLKALDKGFSKPRGLPPFNPPLTEISKISNGLSHRADQVVNNSDQEAKEKLEIELRELDARELLGKNIQIVLDEIERKKKIAAYQLCLSDTNTQGITRKSSELTKLAVTNKLVRSFKAELDRLKFTHLEVEFQPAGGVRGALYHQLVLKRAVGVDLPQVVSEGEASAISIAAFFAELSTAANHSTILFDDPVSSLDHEWRENVANRIVEEAIERQVVVFTHDIVFLLSMVKNADDNNIPYTHQYLRREMLGIGVCSSELPWVAMKVRDRIGVLRNKWQAAEKLHRTASHAEYEEDAIYIYGLLREAWERAIEEVLLAGIVERFRKNIQTMHIGNLANITEEDCQAVEDGITKSSRWLPGHDQAPAEAVPVPAPQELKEDIDSLKTWVGVVNKRRR